VITKSSLASFFNDPESRRRVLENAETECKGILLDLIPGHGPDGIPLDAVDSEKRWIQTKRPEPQEIDYPKSSDEMILSGRAILKDGHAVYWN
jgi:hypothetical protein